MHLVARIDQESARRNRDDRSASQRVISCVGIAREAVSVKGTTSDGLGFAGADGVAAWAVAVVEPIA